MSKSLSNMELNLNQFSPVTQSALQHFNLSARQEKVSFEKGVWANETPPAGYIRLRGNAHNPAFLAATQAALGAHIPCTACTSIKTEFGSMYWLSIDEWLIVTSVESRATLQAKLEQSLKGIHSLVADQSGGMVTIKVLGKHAVDALSHCTVYDLHALKVGKVAGTSFGKLSVFLCADHDGYRLMFRRSFADYIWRYLERAAEPYGFGIANLS